MSNVSASSLNLAGAVGAKSRVYRTESDLENTVAVAVVADLDQQLAAISNGMKRQLEDKQALRGELESIHQLRAEPPATTIDGETFVDLSAEQAVLLGATNLGIPLETEGGEVTRYRLSQDEFQVASQNAVESREGRLGELNATGELTMIQIQSLVDQRKNALMLLSNLLAADHEISKTIIANIRG